MASWTYIIGGGISTWAYNQLEINGTEYTKYFVTTSGFATSSGSYSVGTTRHYIGGGVVNTSNYAAVVYSHHVASGGYVTCVGDAVVAYAYNMPPSFTGASTTGSATINTTVIVQKMHTDRTCFIPSFSTEATVVAYFTENNVAATENREAKVPQEINFYGDSYGS